VVIACQKCGTRFHLDDARIPKKGVRVRCSRCKHAFFARPPGATNDDTLNGIAADAAARPQAPPEPSADLPDPERTAIGFDVASEEEESDWEFNDDFGDDLGDDVFDAGPADAEPGQAPAAEMPEPAAGGELDPNAVTQAPGVDLGESGEGGSSFDFSGFENAESDGPDQDADPVGSNATEVLEPDSQPAAADPPPLAAATSAPSEPSPDHSDTAALEDLGSPEDWDLLGEVEAPSAPAAAPAPTREAPRPAPQEAPAAPPAAAAAKQASAVQPVAPASEPAAPRASQSEPARAPVAPASVSAPAAAEPLARNRASVDVLRLDGVGRALAYGLVGVLFAVGLLRTVAVDPGSGMVVIPPSTTAGSLRVDDLVARTLENAVAGPLYVVTGTLHPAAGHHPGEWLRVSLTDRTGEVLPGGMLVGESESEGRLREADPRAMRARAEGAVASLAWGALPAAGLPFQAVFESVPEEAAGLAFDAAAVASPPPAVLPAEPESSDPATAARRPKLPSSPGE